MTAETILVVDDSKENRDFIVQYVLKPNGYQCLVAKDGRDGLAMALKHRPDLILLDYNMPRLNGAGVLKALDEQDVNIPVILMTFHGSEDIAVEVFRLGVRDYVMKPFYPEDMERAISKSLAEARLTREKEALTNRLIQANRDLQGRLQELNVLSNIGRRVASLADMDQLMPRVVEAAIQITGAEQGAIYLLQDGQLIPKARKRSRGGVSKVESSIAGTPIASHVIKSKQPIIVSTEEANGFMVNGVVSGAYVPLILGQDVIGVLGVENTSLKKPFSQHHSGLLCTLSDYVSIALANARNHEALRQTKEMEKQQIRGTFERLVSPAVVNHALNAPEEVKPGGCRKEVSVLFADVQSYSRWSEEAKPETVVETLNHYLSIAADVIMEWGGTLDKFNGEGIMAIFNAPDEQPDHVYRAVDAALDLMRTAQDIPPINGHKLTFSIGVQVGDAVVGYIGAEKAMNYTAIGDVITLGKRLQEYAAPGQILVEEAVIKRLGAVAQARPLGDLKVKGRKKQAFVYELNGIRHTIPSI